ncbi:MAG: hypothetical protein E4G94_03960 [ANME-2 cluster archaeon]|nr:MAG: hypothetical protein E4G94_03960 [ANME-2 cluster archaeon]
MKQVHLKLLTAVAGNIGKREDCVARIKDAMVLIIVEAGRRFSINPAIFGYQVGKDAWVGGCRWGAPVNDLGLTKSGASFLFSFF